MLRTTRSRLTEVRVRTATADDTKHGRQLFDGLGSHGLYLHVTPAGAKCWVQQLMVPNPATGKSRRVRIGLGAWPRVTLAEARKAAFANRCLRDEGRDPLAAKRQRAHQAAREARVPTFASAIEKVIAIRRSTWKDSDTMAGQFRGSLERYAGALGPIQVSRITTADVMRALSPIWHSVPAGADTARQRISAVLQWTIGQGYRTDDPAAKRAVAAALGAQVHRTEHHRTMPVRRGRRGGRRRARPIETSPPRLGPRVHDPDRHALERGTGRDAGARSTSTPGPGRYRPGG